MMIAKLHHITQNVPGISHAALAEYACIGGVKWVQLRMKGVAYAEWKDAAVETLSVCRKHGARMIVNDNLELAVEIGADGVHLGRTDMTVSEARSIAGSRLIIGATANTFEHIEESAGAGADYIGLGPFRFTTTKENLSPVLGIEGYRGILQRMKQAGITLPVIAIGGITVEDVPSLLLAGLHGVAVSSAINLTTDRATAARAFAGAVHTQTSHT